MKKDFSIYTCGFLLVFFALAMNNAFGQDLGSSNKLFDPASPKTKSTKPPVKKAAPKPKTSSAANTKKAASKPKTSPAKTPPSKPVTAKSDDNRQNTANKPPKQELPNNVVITVGLPVEGNAKKSNPIKNEFNELFEEAIAEGNAARDEREYAKAEAAYLRAQSLQNKDARAIYGLGNLYSDQQRWEEAENAYRTAIEFEPNAAESYVALSFVLTQPIIGADLSDRYFEAEKLARQAIKLDQKNAVGYDQLGVALELQGKIGDETQNAYKKSIQTDPTFALAYAHLGRLMRRKGLTNESSAAYRTAIQLSNDVPTMILVADVMQSQQRYVESEQLLREALREDPKNPTALYLLGRALTIRGSYDEAEKILKKSANVSPNSFVSYVLLSSLYLRLEQFNDAEKSLYKALGMVSPNEKKRLAQDFEAVGDGYYKIGKNKDAARAYRQAVSLDSANTILADKLAKAQAG
ncbi:hypothetical protein BH20ACI1_BH20ACI1_16770 [soil metagenome]